MRDSSVYTTRVEVEETLRTIGIVLAAGLIAVPIAQALRLPVMVVLIAVGLICGPSALDLVSIPLDSAGPSLLFSLGVALIIFHGALGIQLRVISRTVVGLLLLAIPGVMITAGIVALAVIPLFGVSWQIALLAGAVLAATDPAILIPLFDRLGLKPKIAQTVIAESALNDPMGAVFALMMAGIVTASTISGSSSLDVAPAMDLLTSIGIGSLIGVVAGVLMAILLSIHRLGVLRALPAATLLAGLALSYSFSEVAGGSPYLAAFVAGLIVSNKDLLRVDHDQKQEHELEIFTTQTADIVMLAIFVVVGINLNPNLLREYLVPGLLVMAVFVLIARPVTVFACLAVDRRGAWTRQEKTFISWCRETGVVPISLASLLVSQQVEGAEIVLALVTFAVVVTLVLQATTAGWLAGRLGLLATKPLNTGR